MSNIYSLWDFCCDTLGGVGTVTYAFGMPDISPFPHQCVVKLERAYTGAAEIDTIKIVAAPYQPLVHTMKVSAAAQTGLDGATTVANSVAAVGRKGLNAGTWHNRFLVNDADAQTLASNIAKVNLQERTPIVIDTKLNPKYEPWDIITITIFSEYTSQDFEVIGDWHTIDLNEGGGGGSTRLTLRKWTA